MKQATFRGTGQLNGPVTINKTVQIEDSTAIALRGQYRNDVIITLLAQYYPAVKIQPNQIGIEIKEIKQEKKSNSTPNISNPLKGKFTFGSILLWIIFFPFKIAWWLLKKIFTENHV